MVPVAFLFCVFTMTPALTSMSSVVRPSDCISREFGLNRRGLGSQQRSSFVAGLPWEGCGSVVGNWDFRSIASMC